MPTGGGKSTIALAAGRILAREGHKVTVLTHQKILQAQYGEYTFDTSPQVHIATGKSNHPCILEGHTEKTAAEAPCSNGVKCMLRLPVISGRPESIPCPYYRQLEEADAGQLRVLNYPLFIETARRGAKADGDEDSRFSQQELLICDEGHRADKAVLAAVSSTVTLRDQSMLMEMADLRMPKLVHQSLRHNPQVGTWAEEATWQVIKEISKLTALKRDVPENLMKLFFKMNKIKSLVGKSAVIDYDAYGGLQFRPVLSEEFAGPLLLDHAEKTVLLSATIIGGPDYWAGRMGVSPDEVEYMELPSSFPVASRPVFFWPVVQMNNRIWSNDAEIQKMVDAIDQIIAGYLPYKGLVHTANKKLAYYIRDHSRFRNILFVGSAGEILEDFKKASVGVMVSYSATEGVDLPDDLCRFTIFAKIPWLPKNDPVVEVQMEEIPGFYDYEAAASVVQGVGRNMRNEKDWGVNFILDASWRALLARTRNMLPGWFIEAHQEVTFPPMPAQTGVA